MNKKSYLFILLTVLLKVYPVAAQVQFVKLLSPDKAVTYQLFFLNNELKYSINRTHRPVIENSSLGLMINDQRIGTGISIKVLKKGIVNKTYATRGIHSLAIDHYNYIKLKINGKSPFEMEVRVFNDGVAFKYILARKERATITADLTSFGIPSGSTVWSQDNITTYEGNYRQQKIEDIVKEQLAGPPLTFQLPDALGYVAITEGGLTDFAGMSLKADGQRNFTANLAGSTQKKGQIESPWRIIMTGKTLNDLVNNDMISNVSPSADKKLFPKGYQTEWIKPGKCVWSWLANNGPVSFENMKKFSDWAGQLGFAYNLVDDGWAKWQENGKDKWALMKELVDYSNKKGVKIWAWKAYPDRDGEPGIKDGKARIAFFKRCKAIGIAGLKIDFFDTESQEVIGFYKAALKDAAKYHLMLDFHGANKPTGQSRTWPNEMTREGIMGLENHTDWPKHNTTLVFTRFLAGHADYTPLSFNENVKGTTLTHQVATVAAFTSPLMCLGVDPEKLLINSVKNVVQRIPVIWDKTIILPESRIGELVLMARKSGRTWYLVALNGEKAKSLNVDLSFLDKGVYKGQILQDNLSAQDQVVKKHGKYVRNNRITIELSYGGGFVGEFYK